jgi:hypothetical protein
MIRQYTVADVIDILISRLTPEQIYALLLELMTGSNDQ